MLSKSKKTSNKLRYSKCKSKSGKSKSGKSKSGKSKSGKSKSGKSKKLTNIKGKNEKNTTKPLVTSTTKPLVTSTTNTPDTQATTVINYDFMDVIPKLSSEPVHDNAYVWLLMKGDSYLPGIYISVYSVLRTKPVADLVVMVTEDVSDSARKILLKVATHLLVIPYIKFESGPLYTKKQQDLYKNWSSEAYSKWAMMALPHKKALLIDGDTVVLGNLDHLFKLQAPAAPFNNSFVKPLGFIKNFLQGKKAPDGYLDHGEKIQPKTINEILNNGGMLLTASAILLAPSVSDYKEYLQTVKSMQPFGFKCHSMVDEQSIAYYYANVKKQPWTNIHQRYNLIAWKEGFLAKGDVPYILHYFSPQKPWTIEYNKWEDVICWYKMAHEAVTNTNISPSDIFLTNSNVDNAAAADDTFIKKFTKHVPKLKNIKDCLDLSTWMVK